MTCKRKEERKGGREEGKKREREEGRREGKMAGLVALIPKYQGTATEKGVAMDGGAVLGLWKSALCFSSTHFSV